MRSQKERAFVEGTLADEENSDHRGKINLALRFQRAKGNSERERYRGWRNFIIKVTELEDVKGRRSRETNSKETKLFSIEKAHNFLKRLETSRGKGYYYCLLFPITAA